MGFSLSALAHPLRARAEGGQVAGPPVSCSFPELVWAHAERQAEIAQGQHRGPAHDHYVKLLRRFEAVNGPVQSAYWCRYEASAVAVTVRKPPLVLRWIVNPFVQLHWATDWRTADAPEIAAVHHDAETLAIRVGAVLRGPSELIATQWVMAIMSHLLAAVDRPEPLGAAAQRELAAHNASDLREAAAYYRRAGQQSARIVYFWGMIIGALAVTALAGGAVVLARETGFFDLHSLRVQELAISYAMGAIGAVVSVLVRMGRAGRFDVDFEVGRTPMRRLASFRPFIGAVFGLVAYLTVHGNLLQVQPTGNELDFYAVLAFTAGFSERFVKGILSDAGRQFGGEEHTVRRARAAPQR